MHAPAITFEVANRFHGLRRRYLAARLIACLCFGSAALLFGWMLLAVGDYFWELPLLARRSLMIGISVLVGIATLWESTRTVSDSRSGRFVGRLERQFDLLGQRLRTLLETVEGRWRAPEAMLQALGHQTMGRWETVQPNQVIPRRMLTAAAFCVALMACVALVGYFASGDQWRTAMLRALGSEAAYTQLVVAPGDARLLEGAELSVRLQLQGRTNRACMLRYRNSDSPEWTETTLGPSPGATERSASFEANLGRINQSMDYQFITSVGNTQTYTITMQPLIEVEDFSIDVTPPEYTHLPSRSFSSAELSVLQGSQVSVTLKTNHPLSEVQLQVGPSDKTLAAIDVEKGDNPRLWRFALPTEQSLRWHFAGTGTDGTPMKPVRGRLNVRYDQSPKIEWQEPLDELTVHMLSEVPMQVQVSDDYGVAEAGIVFQLGDEEFVLKQWPDKSNAPSPAPGDAITSRLRLAEVLPLESFALSEKDFVAYYAFATDNREGAPQQAESEVRYIDIRPLKQFFSELDADLSGGTGRRVPGLDEIIRRERFLINRTRSLARSPAASGPERTGVIERMVEGQSELADLTRFLMEFLISQGTDDTESLSQAEAAMLQAADSLSGGNFDTALIQEQNALRFLAEARRTLEIILSRNPTAQQQQAMSQFRRQMQQRLRRTEQTDAKLADTLKQIAEEQMQVAEAAEKIVQNQTTAAPQSGSPIPSTAMPSPDGRGQAGTPADENAPTDGANATQPAVPPVEGEPGEQVRTQQQELLDRLAEIDSGLSNEVKRSDLATERMQEALAAMDELVTDAGQKNWSGMPARGKLLAEQLHELASHIDALAESEPAQRVSGARDMTTSLANMEGELANVELAIVAALQPKSPPAAETDATATDALRAKAERMSRRMQERAATLADVLAQPAAAADVAGNEVYEQLQQLAEQRKLAEQLEASRVAGAQPNSEKETSAWADAAMNRATEYADVATQLEGLYRQLVMPRLDNLRRLESKASALARALDAELKGKGAGSNENDMSSDSPLTAAAVGRQQRELEQELAAAGLEELADQLRQDDGEVEGDDDETETLESIDALATEGRRSARLFTVSQLQASRSRAIRVDRQLQEILRDLILSEISADQNMPVPPEYKELVDRYFRSISGGAAAQEVLK